MKRVFSKNIILIGVISLLLLSCTQEHSITLCNVRLNTDEATRAFTPVTFNNNLSSYTLYYSTSYLGTDSSYYGVETDQKYDSNSGILLSQGRWSIDCVWKNKKGTVVAKGSTGPIWVNLNTTSFLVYLDMEGIGSADFEYVVNKASGDNNTITDVKFNLSLSKWDGEKLVSVDGITTLDGEKGTEGNCLRTYRDSFNDLEVGKYVLVIKTIDNTSSQTDDFVLFTDVIGFIVKPEHKTIVVGSCEVIKGTSGKHEYITWEPNPAEPTIGNVVPVGGDTKDSSGNTVTNGVLNDPNLNLKDETVIVINKDTDAIKNPNNDDKMSLGHTDENNRHSNRVITPPSGTAEDPVNFGINLNGTDVVLSTLNSGYSSESSAIISLPQYSEMTIYNNCATKREATWAKMETTPIGDRRYEANVMLQGGTLNVVGPRTNSISNADVIFQGPLHSDVDNYKTIGLNEYHKQGSINVYSPGGSIILDGGVTLIGATGISSWATLKTAGSTLSGKSNTNIVIKNGAKINATGDSHTQLLGSVDCSDTAYGIKLIGKSSTTDSSINITLDNGTINTNNIHKTDKNEAGIYIENFAGAINITLINGSSITTSGTAIKLVDCTGQITIQVENGCTISAPNQLYQNGTISSLI